MSIDATIVKVSSHGSMMRLWLSPRDPKENPYGDGQDFLYIVNPDKKYKSLKGKNIWGCSSKIYMGDSTLAERIGYTKIRINHEIFEKSATPKAFA